MTVIQNMHRNILVLERISVRDKGCWYVMSTLDQVFIKDVYVLCSILLLLTCFSVSTIQKHPQHAYFYHLAS